ncbi:hypothetical protein GCM10009687_68090 [Asanoa iriomotensis]|uniref:Uncharacterized protein n=2 Tax=Asanoa iriomotensis TaxID=234613 RepID=A0ABQ4C5D7_9ACTN|nr:hypothetical protein Air01nite_40860 [Asanoa iriomotensis]
MVVITLAGPDAMHCLDRVELTLRPTHRAQWNSPGPLVKVGNHYRFNPGEGDAIDPAILVLDDVVARDPRIALLEPVDYKPADGSYRPPIRLMAACHLQGHEPWQVPITVTKMDELRLPRPEPTKVSKLQ